MSNADDDMCACGSGACDFYARLNRAQNANAVWRKITAQPLRYGPHGPVESVPQPAPSGDEAKVLDMDDETLVAEIAFEVGQATKQQPEMGGRCRRLHDDAENRRIARAAIRAINRIARRGSEGT